MSWRWCTSALAIALGLGACGFSASNNPGGGDGGNEPQDAAIDAYIPDAGPCPAKSAECIGEASTLRECKTPGELPVDTVCTWGCSSAGMPHCAKLLPTGGTLTSTDLDPKMELGDVSFIATGSINTDTGEISNVRAPGAGVINGIEFSTRGAVGIFRFNKLTITAGALGVTGSRALALVAITEMRIVAELDLQGDCNGRNAGPGGSQGGAKASAAAGSGGGGAGQGVDNACSGGGGGGYGANGGDGGNASNKGSAFGTDAISVLVGGGGGGGGGGAMGGDGAGGGGAIQLVANRKITFEGIPTLAGGAINVGGCGGKPGGGCGGGGGAGGTIVMEAPAIVFNGSTFAANGGGGAGGNNGIAGSRAQLGTTKASGGRGGGNGPMRGGDGGDGGDDGALAGSNGGGGTRGGGGGGGVGRMRFNTYSGKVVVQNGAVFSPALSTVTTPTPVVRGVANVQ